MQKQIVYYASNVAVTKAMKIMSKKASALIGIIDMQPTTYDVDKVVNELEERKEQLKNDLAKDYYGIREYENRSDEIEIIAEIVKSGGIHRD